MNDNTNRSDRELLEYLRVAATILGQPTGDLRGHLRTVGDLAAEVPSMIDRLRDRLSRQETEQLLSGVLVGAEQLDRGKVRYAFLPTVGRYAGKYIDPNERSREGVTAYDTDNGGRYVPFVETWTGDFLSDRNGPTDAAADFERSRSLIGRHVTYRTHRDTDAKDAPKGGYRCFDGFVDTVALPDPAMTAVFTTLAAALGVVYVTETTGTGPDPAAAAPQQQARAPRQHAAAPPTVVDIAPTPDRAAAAETMGDLHLLQPTTTAEVYLLAEQHFSMTNSEVNTIARRVLGAPRSGQRRSPEELTQLWRMIVHGRAGQAA